ncbi:MAG: TerC family protein [Armatimonadetes bacterium]|nr:TerC family protein [Armatimonadota bacterium]MBM3738901.1 TerC family protein [Acidobacteriota bacterium]
MEFNAGFLLDILSIVLIDLLLAGDNAVVIALAVRNLPPAQRRLGISIGAGVAVVLRIVVTFFAAQLLQMSYIKLVGGLALLWIAVKVIVDSKAEEEGGEVAASLWQAMWIIMVADITMSTDNILAVAGASKGNMFLLLFGLGLSIPFVVFTSGLLSRLMDRYPVIIYIGSAVLGRVAAEMIMTDPWFTRTFHPAKWMIWTAEVVSAAAVVLVGWMLLKRKRH